MKLKSKKSLRKEKRSKKEERKRKGRRWEARRGKGKEKQTNEGDWECRACNPSFSQDEENGNECASGYSVASAKRYHTLIVSQTSIECFSHLTQTRKMSICVLPAVIWKVK